MLPAGAVGEPRGRAAAQPGQREKPAGGCKDEMTGTLLNILTILIGGSLCLLFGARLSGRLKQTVIAGLALFTAMTGIKMFLETGNSLIVLGSLLIGALLGEWWKI